MKGAGKPKQMVPKMPMKGMPVPGSGQITNAPGFKKGGMSTKSKKKK